MDLHLNLPDHKLFGTSLTSRSVLVRFEQAEPFGGWEAVDATDLADRGNAISVRRALSQGGVRNAHNHYVAWVIVQYGSAETLTASLYSYWAQRCAGDIDRPSLVVHVRRAIREVKADRRAQPKPGRTRRVRARKTR